MPATKTAKTLALTCPFCGSGDELTLDLNDLRKVSCGSCSEERTPEEFYAKANEVAARWSAALAWIKMAPIAD